jgi:hypothetical protein
VNLVAPTLRMRAALSYHMLQELCKPLYVSSTGRVMPLTAISDDPRSSPSYPGVGYVQHRDRLHSRSLSRKAIVYKEGEGECRTAYILCVTVVGTVHDLRNVIHVWRST